LTRQPREIIISSISFINQTVSGENGNAFAAGGRGKSLNERGFLT
jgi:hypothetical protein